jgi:hypothetical protein
MTSVLANDSNQNFCFLGVSERFDGDEAGDGYSPLGVFGPGDDRLNGDDDGNSGGGDDDTGETGDQTNR